eukprot:362982-Chlamydomonas_euryale.AAC.4
MATARRTSGEAPQARPNRAPSNTGQDFHMCPSCAAKKTARRGLHGSRELFSRRVTISGPLPCTRPQSVPTPCQAGLRQGP